jgi:hypothetical protein
MQYSLSVKTSFFNPFVLTKLLWQCSVQKKVSRNMSSSIPGDTTTQVSGIVEGVIFVPSLLLKVDAKRSSLYQGMHLCSGYLLNPLFICVLEHLLG